MIQSFSVAIAALVLTGCAAATELRTEMISVGPSDGSWTLRLQAVAQGDTCGLGYGEIGIASNLRTPLGGGFVATVTDESKKKTLGELNLVCQTAPPGGSASCTTPQPLTFPCQFIHIDATRVQSTR